MSEWKTKQAIDWAVALEVQPDEIGPSAKRVIANNLREAAQRIVELEAENAALKHPTVYLQVQALADNCGCDASEIVDALTGVAWDEEGGGDIRAALLTNTGTGGRG